MYGLEYAMVFGVPDNKVELLEGGSRWAFPFKSREQAELHFEAWLDTFCRWKQLDRRPTIRKSAKRWQAKFAGIRMEIHHKPIDMRFAIVPEAFRAFLYTFNRRDYWPGQPAGLETGWDSMFDDGDVRMNLWKLFETLTDRHGGMHSGRVDIVLSDTAAVSPDAYYYRKGRRNLMIEGDYFCAAPDVIAEVLSAPGRWLDRGERMEVYRRAGVPHLWLVEPALEIVEVYALGKRYELQGRFGASDSFNIDLFPNDPIRVDDLFDTQSKRHERLRKPSKDERAPIPEWLVPKNLPIGLEYFFVLGHPERRWEVWNNKAHSVLAFGSATEAKARMDHFVTEACHWEALANRGVAKLADDVDQAEAGRFQLRRKGRLVFLDVVVDCRRYRDLLKIWSKREAWDWGED